ncbi:MAG: alpha/beta hydrolase [Actinomycetota bacterium]|nr:alpha/beta hydrolase [Actinomycetota bacterium]
MKVTKSRVAIGAAVAAAAGLAGAAATGAITLHRWRRRPDPARADDFEEPAGTTHRTFTSYDGGEIHLVERGEGRPFFLLHGVTESTLVWHYQLLDLAEAGFRVVAMDVRGQGRSQAGRDGYSLIAMARDAFQVIQELDLHEAVVVGHSMGAMILLQLLADHPELVADGAVSSIVLLATSASPILGNGVPAAAAEMVRVLTPLAGRGHIRATGGRVRRDLASGDLAAAYCRLAFGSDPSPTHVEVLRAMTSAVPGPIIGQLLKTLLNLDVRPVLPAIAAPALVVVGQRDLLTPVWHSRCIANRIPVAELHVLPGCGHMVMFERRAELGQLLVDFAQRTKPVSQPAMLS